MNNSGYDAGRGGGPFAAFFLSVTVIMVALSSACYTMSSWVDVVGSKLGTAKGVTP